LRRRRREDAKPRPLMARLRHQELKAFAEALLELYSPGPLADFPDKVSAGLRRCLSFESLAYHEIIDNQNQRVISYPEILFDLKAFETYLDQHPNWNAFTRDRVESSVKISDFVTRSEWERTDLYNYIFRPFAIRDQLGFITLGALPQLGIGLNRSRRDFSEEERSILDLLKPHLTQAFSASQLFSYFSDATDTFIDGYIVADRAGRIRFCTSKAARWLAEYFDSQQNSLLPSQLRDWLKNRSLRLFNPDNLSAPLTEFSIQRGAKRLIVESLSPIQTPDHRLVLREKTEALDAALLERLGLTKREAEVLLWVSQGKTNPEIATILGTKPKTITKHLERVFSKLGVETRTSAANVARDILRS
jgi:DNA-binding CsgD family transcriptional regulator